MSQTHDAIDTVPSEVDDLDVEGHGMKEVALGVGAATLLASGSGIAVAAAADDPLGGTTSGARTAAEALQQGAQNDLRSVSAAAERLAQTGVSAVVPIGTQAQSLVQETATTAGSTAGSAAGAALDAAGAVASDPWGTTDRAVYKAVEDARELRDTARTTAGSTAAAAQHLAAQAAAQVGRDVADAQKTVQTTADDAVTRAGTTASTTAADAQRLAGAAAETAIGIVGEDTGVTVDRSGGTTTVSAKAAGHSTEVKVGND